MLDRFWGNKNQDTEESAQVVEETQNNNDERGFTSMNDFENEVMQNETEDGLDKMDLNLPEEVKSTELEKEYNLADGTPCSKSMFIREQFSKFNKSRKQIAEEYGIPYRAVYGATVNMENEAEPTSRGRGVTFSKINVTENNEVVFVKEGVVYINGEVQPEGTATPETIAMDRNEWIKTQIANGATRGEIAKILDLSYGVVYSLTKEAEGSKQKYEITLPDGSIVSRSEYIRKRVAEGVSKGEIAKELNVEYSVVWQATKKMKTVEEKFFDAVKNLEKFMDFVENPELITKAIDSLNNVVIKMQEADKVAETDISELENADQ